MEIRSDKAFRRDWKDAKYQKALDRPVNSRPLLSVLIPTKNRADTAIESIGLAISIGDENEVEIVVQDCGTSDELKNLIDVRGFMPRVKYSRSQVCSMNENWSLAVENASGEYIIIIGDDDAVLPTLTRVVRWAYDTGVEAIAFCSRSFYGWPDFPEHDKAGLLLLSEFTGICEIRKSEDYLKICCDTGDKYRELPSLYHGVAKRSVLDAIKCKSGKYFDGLSPDFYSAYAIAMTTKEYAVLNCPATMVGASFSSNWGRASRKMIDAHLREFEGFEFSPLSPSSNKLWSQGADCMIKVMEAMGRQDLFAYYNIERVYARTMCREPALAIKHFLKFMSGVELLGRNRILAVGKLLANIAGFYFIRVARFVLPKKAKKQIKWPERIKSIAEAVEIQNNNCGVWLSE